LTVTNRSSAPCYLFGYPTVTFLDRNGGALPFAYRQAGDIVVTSRPPTRVELTPGMTAYVTTDQYRCDLGDQGVTMAVQLTLPDDAVSLVVPLPPEAITLGYCGPGEPGSVVFVSPVEATVQDTVAH
jgi:hypothetical protein